MSLCYTRTKVYDCSDDVEEGTLKDGTVVVRKTIYLGQVCGRNYDSKALDRVATNYSKMAELGLGPRIYGIEKNPEFVVIYMEKLPTEFDNAHYHEHKNQIKKRIQELHDAGFIHLDLHRCNIMFDEDMKVMFIDFDTMISIEEANQNINDIKGDRFDRFDGFREFAPFDINWIMQREKHCTWLPWGMCYRNVWLTESLWSIFPCKEQRLFDLLKDLAVLELIPCLSRGPHITVRNNTAALSLDTEPTTPYTDNVSRRMQVRELMNRFHSHGYVMGEIKDPFNFECIAMTRGMEPRIFDLLDIFHVDEMHDPVLKDWVAIRHAMTIEELVAKQHKIINEI